MDLFTCLFLLPIPSLLGCVKAGARAVLGDHRNGLELPFAAGAYNNDGLHGLPALSLSDSAQDSSVL